jgi:hypothetical protein
MSVRPRARTSRRSEHSLLFRQVRNTFSCATFPPSWLRRDHPLLKRTAQAMMNRRQVIKGCMTALAAFGIPSKLRAARSRRGEGSGKIPLVHITDLYHPPQDPDDHIDLLTAFALEEFNLRGVILDVTKRFLLAAPAGFDIAREPGFAPVAQLAYLLGRPAASAVGPVQPLSHPGDDAADRPLSDQGGICLLLEILEDSREPVVVSVVGSARVLTAAYNRNPALLRAKVRSILLNAGSIGGLKQEWNVGLDPAAYVGLWRSGLPIHWFPCATEKGAFDTDHERGTYWKTLHGVIFRDLPKPLRTWFAYGLSGSTRGDILRVLSEEESQESWDAIMRGTRNLWSTASLVMAAGRTLARTPRGWRFVRGAEGGYDDAWPWRLDPIKAEVNAEASVQWRLVDEGGNARLFGRRRGSGFGEAMAEALNALLGSLRVEGGSLPR